MNVHQPAKQPTPYRRIFDADGLDGAECRTQIWKGAYEFIYQATPAEVTAAFLERLATCPTGLRIFAEKPWFPSLAEARRLEERLEASPHSVRYIDHYLHRPVCEGWLWHAPLEFFLGGRPAAVEGALFESPAPLSPSMVATGALFDLLPHLVSLTHRLFPGERIEVTSAFGARQDGWPGPTENFACLRGVIDTGRDRVPVSLAAGKCHPDTQKWLALHGPRASLRLDFVQESADLIFPNGDRRRLYPAPGTEPQAERPYAFILRTLLQGRGETVGLDLSQALGVLRVLDDARQRMPSPLPRYPKGAYPPVP
jgi:hypothetical protein